LGAWGGIPQEEKNQREEVMIFPTGKVRHQNLMTSYTDLPALLSTLKSEGFSGTVEIEFSKDHGVLFVDAGEVINAEVKVNSNAKRMIGPEAIQHLLTLSGKKEGILNIYQLSPEQVALVASNLDHEVLFKGLSTDFTRLDRLLLKLKEEKHDGFIEILTRESRPVGVLFLQEGEPAGMFTVSESAPSVFGRKSIPTFVENAIKEGAIFNVCRRRGKSAQTDLAVAEGVVLEAMVPEGVTLEERGRGLHELIPIFEEVLSKAEQFVDGVSRKGRFLGAFKKTLLDKSDRYPFLDPFSGEFEYREGTISFTGDVKEKEFFKGVGECLLATLSQMDEELPKKKMLSLKLRAEIESTLEPHRETMKRLGLDSVLPSFFQ